MVSEQSLKLHAAPQCSIQRGKCGNVGCRGRDRRHAAFPTRLLRACMTALNAIWRTEPHAASASVEIGVAKDSTKRAGRGLIHRIGSGKAFFGVAAAVCEPEKLYYGYIPSCSTLLKPTHRKTWRFAPDRHFCHIQLHHDVIRRVEHPFTIRRSANAIVCFNIDRAQSS